MADSVFTKIVKGELPSHKIYEDDKTLAFMDIHPVQPGMVVVVPKVQIEEFFNLSDEDYRALWQAVRTVAKKLKQVFPAKKRIAVQVEGLDIDHVHVKLFPVDSGAELRTEPDFDSEPDHDALAKIATKLRINR